MEITTGVMTYKLMIKQHYETGIQYLCVTKRKKWEAYKGSGLRWKRLINSQPQRILTILLYTDDDLDTFDAICKCWSDHFDVVNNKNFANLVPEYGYSGNDNNFAEYYSRLTDDEKIVFLNRRNNSIRAFYASDIGKSVKIEASRRQSELMSDLKTRLDLQEKMAAWYADPSNAEQIQNRNSKIHLANLTPETKLKRSKAQKTKWKDPSYREKQQNSISKGRLQMQQEQKNLRAARVGESFLQSEVRQQFIESMKIDRLGNLNPNAIAVMWDGLRFETSKEFTQYARENGMNLRECNLILKSDKDPNRRKIRKPSKTKKQVKMLTCSHCDIIKMQSQSSAFNRWHNNNCKHKGK